VPESKAARPRKADPAGQTLIALTLAGLVFGVIEGPKLGWGTPAIIVPLAVAAAALAGFLVVESRKDEPLLDLRFFRSVPFSAANLIAVFSFASLGTFLYLNSIYLQEARGYSPLDAGLLMVPLAAVSVLWGPRNGKILSKHGARVPLIIAGTALTAAAVILTLVSLTTPIAWLLIAYALMGLGNSAVGAPITYTAVEGMPREQAGVAAGVSSSTRQIGQTVGVAIAGVTLAAGSASRAGIATATHLGWTLNIGYGIAVLILGVLSTTAWAKATAHGVATEVHDTPWFPTVGTVGTFPPSKYGVTRTVPLVIGVLICAGCSCSERASPPLRSWPSCSWSCWRGGLILARWGPLLPRGRPRRARPLSWPTRGGPPPPRRCQPGAVIRWGPRRPGISPAARGSSWLRSKTSAPGRPGR
jgi:MFS family permease